MFSMLVGQVPFNSTCKRSPHQTAAPIAPATGHTDDGFRRSAVRQSASSATVRTRPGFLGASSHPHPDGFGTTQHAHHSGMVRVVQFFVRHHLAVQAFFVDGKGVGPHRQQGRHHLFVIVFRGVMQRRVSSSVGHVGIPWRGLGSGSG